MTSCLNNSIINTRIHFSTNVSGPKRVDRIWYEWNRRGSDRLIRSPVRKQKTNTFLLWGGSRERSNGQWFDKPWNGCRTWRRIGDSKCPAKLQLSVLVPGWIWIWQPAWWTCYWFTRTTDSGILSVVLGRLPKLNRENSVLGLISSRTSTNSFFKGVSKNFWSFDNAIEMGSVWEASNQG